MHNLTFLNNLILDVIVIFGFTGLIFTIATALNIPSSLVFIQSLLIRK